MVTLAIGDYEENVNKINKEGQGTKRLLGQVAAELWLQEHVQGLWAQKDDLMNFEHRLSFLIDRLRYDLRLELKIF